MDSDIPANGKGVSNYEAFILNVETTYGEYLEWSEQYILPKNFLEAMKKRGSRKKCYHLQNEHYCNFRLPKGTITFMMSSVSSPSKPGADVYSARNEDFNDSDQVNYEVSVVIATMNYGTDDIFSSSHYYFGTEFKRMLRETGIIQSDDSIVTLLRNWK